MWPYETVSGRQWYACSTVINSHWAILHIFVISQWHIGTLEEAIYRCDQMISDGVMLVFLFADGRSVQKNNFQLCVLLFFSEKPWNVQNQIPFLRLPMVSCPWSPNRSQNFTTGSAWHRPSSWHPSLRLGLSSSGTGFSFSKKIHGLLYDSCFSPPVRWGLLDIMYAVLLLLPLLLLPSFLPSSLPSSSPDVARC